MSIIETTDDKNKHEVVLFFQEDIDFHTLSLCIPSPFILFLILLIEMGCTWHAENQLAMSN